MTTYLIALTEENPAVWAAIEAKWPNHSLEINKTLAVISAEGVVDPNGTIKAGRGHCRLDGKTVKVCAHWLSAVRPAIPCRALMSTTVVDWL